MISSAAETRKFIIEYLRNELVGPENYKEVSAENKYAGYPAVQLNGQEILKLHERPLEKYSAGVLFPLKSPFDTISAKSEDISLDTEKNDLNEEMNQTQITVLGSHVDTDTADETDRGANLTNEYSPSAIGLSFLIDISDGFLIIVKAGYYTEESLLSQKAWFRHQIHETIILEKHEVDTKKTEVINKHIVNDQKERTGLEVHIVCRPYKDLKNLKMVTVSLVNRHLLSAHGSKDVKSFFQAGIEICSQSQSAVIKSYPKDLSTMDDEQLSLELLYRHKTSFAVGHGCAVSWPETEERSTTNIWTEIVPVTEIKPILPTSIKDTNLSMYDMAHGDTSSLLNTCQTIADKYKSWIDETYKVTEKLGLDEKLKEQAYSNLIKAKECAQRIEGGISLLKESSDVLKSFRWMNQTMYMQHSHYSISVNSKREWTYADQMLQLEREYVEPDYNDDARSWRPFQLAFILMNLVSMDNPQSDERDIVDLIWFPTGGGKTEAYLGLTSFTLFLRRLKNPNNTGTAVFMRYTLRLLTTQQFQRASSMICASEVIRRQNSTLLGEEKYSIGLWVGGAVSPNTEKEAKFEKTELERGNTSINKFVITSCPWCGAAMGPVKKGNRTTCKGYKGSYRRSKPPTTRFVCEDEQCEFNLSKGGLPLAVIDEHIYNEPPSLLFSTVDKFAQLPFKTEAGSIFGIGTSASPPELIIQDELHLISGPLGSMVGHYETAIDALCTELNENGYKPKIVASTATISKADEQIKSLYAREGFLFPPQAIKAGDSFFAEEKEEFEGRIYIGIMATALNSHVTSQVRTIAVLLQSIVMLDDVKNEYLDPYWTIMGYFNSLRELGHATTMVSADIREFLNVLWSNRGIHLLRLLNKDHEYRRFINRYLELTSRMNSSDIPISLQELFTTFDHEKSNRPIDLCFATNMIQVGLDVGRLSLMTIIGQPKTTAEYIQASSRVGRELDKPGLVVTNFNPGKPRDRSHYEDFKNYHQSIYKFVEPTSVTPFSVPVRERAIAALIVILIRYLYPEYRDNPQIVPDNDARQRIKNIILDRVNIVEDDELVSTEIMIDDFFNEWELSPPPRYGEYALKEEMPLVYPAGTEKLDEWDERAIEIPSSMRSVDRTCEATMFYPAIDDNE